MNYKITSEDIALLKRIKDRIIPTNNIITTYITRSQALRRQADTLDKEAEDNQLFIYLLHNLQNDNK